MVPVAFGLFTILTGAAWSLFSSSSLPPPQPAHPPGTFILKKDLVFAGYATPEAALESLFWSFANADHNGAVTSVVTNQAIREFGRDPKKFREQAKEFDDLASFQILARKDIADDKVELRFEELDKGADGTDDSSSIVVLLKVGAEWKVDFSVVRDYKTNWDDANIIRYGHRELAPSKPGSKPRYSPIDGIVLPPAHLKDVGYATPEDAFETEQWVLRHLDQGRSTASPAPEPRPKPAAASKTPHAGLVVDGDSTMHIIAKKQVAPDKVELLIGTEMRGDGAFGFMMTIQEMVKVDDAWKFGALKTEFSKDWENDSEPEPNIKR